MEMISKKPLTSSCLFCVNSSTSVRKFKITEDYGGGNTIRYDLTSFLGHQIEPYLKDDDVLCSNCMNFFENMAYTKRQLIDFLRNRDESPDIKMQGFSTIWKGFTKFAVNLVKFNPNDSDETWDASELQNRSLTPNPLVHTHSEPYNQVLETKISEFERARSKSVAPSEGFSETDLEVRALFGKPLRRKKRGHNWTRRRGEQKSRALSRTYPAIYDTYERNCYTSMTGLSESSFNESTYSSKTTDPRRKRKKVQGKPVKTRSTSRLENYLATVTAEKELSRYYCEEINCSLFFQEIENFVRHKRFDHHIIARFPCQQCPFKATTKDELDTHTTKKHDVEIIMCFQCKAEIQGTKKLQQHLERHQEYSIGCKFCYLNFLYKADLVDHVAKEHQGQKRKKVHERQSFVLQAVVNEDKMREPRKVNENNNNFMTKEFKSIVLRAEKSPSPEVDRRSLLSVHPISVSGPIKISDESPSITVISNHSVDVSNEKTSADSETEFHESQTLEPLSKSIADVPQIDVNEFVAPINTKNDSTMFETNLQLTRLIPVVVIERLDLNKSQPKS